ncbi:MAG: hypothetical protein GEU26_12735 [Nitrososphaeraceae archaeon]|nr:hypothetical protein [Nitrososphaeraceae archaeon]
MTYNVTSPTIALLKVIFYHDYTLPQFFSYSIDYMVNWQVAIMHKHKLIELRKIVEEKIGSLREEVEIATNVKPNPSYISDRKDEIEFLQWVTRIIKPILNHDNDEPQQLGAIKMRVELADTIRFENLMNERVQELNLKLKESNNLRESDILINEIDTLESTLGRLSDLKYGDKARAIEIAEANNNFQQANRLRKQLIKIQDMELEIGTQIQMQK